MSCWTPMAGALSSPATHLRSDAPAAPQGATQHRYLSRCGASAAGLLVAEGDSTLGEVVGADRNSHPIAEDDADAVAAQSSCEVGVDITNFGIDQEISTLVDLFDDAFKLNQIVACHLAFLQTPLTNEATR